LQLVLGKIIMQLESMQIKIGEKNHHFHYRSTSNGDRGVIKQIFSDQDYNMSSWHQGQSLHDYYRSCLRDGKTPLIVDAGANIGASAVYFAGVYSEAFVVTLEPEVNNWHILEMNTSEIGRIRNFNAAITDTDCEMKLIDPGLSDWGYRVSKDSAVRQPGASAHEAFIKGLSPRTILNDKACIGKAPLILKIDIEGAEDALFSGDTDWLDLFPCVIIELHDWMLPFSGSSRNFLRAVTKHDFDLIHRGENTFLFNRKHLAPFYAG